MGDKNRGVKTRRSLFISPPSAAKASKKAKTISESYNDSESDDVIVVKMANRQQDTSGKGSLLDISSIHEAILTRVNEALSIFKPVEGADVDPIMKAVPVIATAVSVAVGEVMKGMVKMMEDSLLHVSSPREERLFAAVRNLTYENDRLQQYSRRESVKIVGIPNNQGETIDQVEEKVLKVFSDAGASVQRADIAVAHRAGRERNGSRPILVKFVSRRTRNEVNAKKKNLKGKDGYQRVFINDDITPLRARLLGYVKGLGCVERAWTIDGRIHCVKKSPLGLAPTDRPRPLVIETPDDLFKLGLDHIDYSALGLDHLAEGDSQH